MYILVVCWILIHNSWFFFQSVLNFTFTLKKPPDGNWGALQSDGTWNGMVKLLQDQKADIGRVFCFSNCSNLLWELVFYFQNCSDLLWKNLHQWSRKTFANLKLKAENLQKFWNHLNNLFKQWKFKTISGNRMLF